MRRWRRCFVLCFLRPPPRRLTRQRDTDEISIAMSSSPSPSPRATGLLLLWPTIVAALGTLVALGPFLLSLSGDAPDAIEPEQLVDLVDPDPDSRFVSVLGHSIHYKDKSTGTGTDPGEPVFVCLHGFGARAFSFRRVIGPLSQFGRVVVFDRIGHGLSARPTPADWPVDEKSPYAPSRQPDFVIGLLDALGISRPAVLIGNSAGGSVALRTALKYPDRVLGLVIAAADWKTAGIMPTPSLHWLWNTRWMRQVGGWAFGKLLGEGNAEMLLELGWHDRSKFTEEEFQEARKYFRVKGLGAGYWEWAAANEVNRLPDTVSQIKLPTLVIAGRQDKVVPFEDAEVLARLVPGAKLVGLEGCGHLPQEERADEFVEAVKEFVVSIRS